MRVRMYPHLNDLDSFSSGIAQVIKYYFRHLPDYGVELVTPNATTYDLDAGHAAAYPGAMVNHSHGLLWTGHYKLSGHSWSVNADLAQAARRARRITTPSQWVADTFRRDMRVNPSVIPHGVDWEAWQHDRDNEGYVLWAKNRTSDGLIPEAVNDLALAFPDVEFVTTFAAGRRPSNLRVLGAAIPYEQMKILIQQAAVVLATDKETWGILPAEAMAAGVPVLSVDCGAVPEFLEHGVAGYCFRPGNLDDAVRGLQYCLTHRERLGANGRELIRAYSWERAAKRVAAVYESALQEQEPTVDVVIPCHNYGRYLDGAIRSALEQTYPINRVLIVDDASSDGTPEIVRGWMEREGRVDYIRVQVRNVGKARNCGIRASDAKYIVPLDADDAIGPRFVERLVPALEDDPALGIAYTGVKVELEDGTVVLPHDWPGEIAEGEIRSERVWPTHFSYEEQLSGHNWIPTCCLIRREALERVGGYRARYAPEGAGSEDANLFARIPSIGYAATYIPSTEGGLFFHRHGEGYVSSAQNYQEVNWLSWYPWVRDGQHPFASVAKPIEDKPSHPVRFYDQPAVSVIIPVGTGHEERVVNAIDSLEAQTFRNWEAVVVWDSTNPVPKWMRRAYPYINFRVPEPPGLGAGRARNHGAAIARSPMLAFLDADDYYHPQFLEKALERFWQTRRVVYADFVSRMSVEQHREFGGKVVRRFENKQEVLVFDSFDDFDCRRARQRPTGSRPYVWSGVTVLLPKLWHDHISGFDETYDTWEDCDYLLRLAWHGYCFSRISEPLWVYDFTSGVRRDGVYGNEPELMEKIQEKYDATGVDIMGCDCEGTRLQEAPEVTQDETLTVLYNHPNRGNHMVHGGTTRKRYGNFGGGSIIQNMAKIDVRARPHLFLCPNCREPFSVTQEDVFCPNCSRISQVIAKGRPVEQKPIVEEPAPPSPPEPIAMGDGRPQDDYEQLINNEDDNASVKIADVDFGRSVNSRHKEMLALSGVETFDDVRRLGKKSLMEIPGIGESVATTLIHRAEKEE